MKQFSIFIVHETSYNCVIICISCGQFKATVSTLHEKQSFQINNLIRNYYNRKHINMINPKDNIQCLYIASLVRHI